MRYLFGLTGASLIDGAVAIGAPRTSDIQISSYLTDVRPALDIDGNGQAEAWTDGLLVIRYLSGLRGDSLIAGAMGSGARRSSTVDIETYIDLNRSLAASNSGLATSSRRFAQVGVVASSGRATSMPNS